MCVPAPDVTVVAVVAVVAVAAVVAVVTAVTRHYRRCNVVVFFVFVFFFFVVFFLFFLFQLKAEKHPRFTRRGNDLHHTMHISLKDALLGFRKTIQHLDSDGREVVVERKKGSVTKPFEVMKLKGEGMPHYEFPSERGALHVKVRKQQQAASSSQAVSSKEPAASSKQQAPGTRHQAAKSCSALLLGGAL